MSKKSELLKNTIIIGVGRLSTQLISFLLLPLYTTLLSPSDYGTVDLIITYVALLTPVVTIQLELAAFRFLVDVRRDESGKERVISSIFRIITPILLIFIVLCLILSLFIKIRYMSFMLLIMCLTILSSLFLQIARGLGKNSKYAIASIITGLTIIVTNILTLVVLHMGIQGMLLSMVLSNIACCLYLFLSLRLYRYIKLGSNDKYLRKDLIRYSFPLVPNGISWWVINVSDRTIISIVIGVAANGIYAVANKYSAILTSFFSVFNMSWTESASIHIDSDDRDKFFSSVYNSSLRFFGSLGLMLIAVLPLFFNVLVGVQFRESYVYIPILIIAAIFNLVVSMYGAIYIAKRLTNKVFVTSLMVAIINICLNVIFIKSIGIYAAALSTAIAYLVMAVSRHYDVKKYVSIKYDKNLILRLTIIYALSCALYYTNNLVGNIANTAFAIVVVLTLNRLVISGFFARIKSQ